MTFENQFTTLIKHTPAAVAVFDEHMCYLAHSDRWLNDYGLGNRNIIGQSHYDVFPDINEKWKADHQRVLQGETFISEDEWQRENGDVIYLKYQLRPWKNRLGEIKGLIMFTEVITEVVETRKALERRNEELQGIFDAFPDMFFRLDEEGTYLDYKAGAKETFIPPEQFMGKTIPEIMPPDMAKQQMSLLHKCLESGETIHMEYSLPSATGTEHFELRFLPMKNREALAVIREITPLVNSRIKLEKTVNELKRSNLDLEQFAFVASHDLREPIRMVGSFAQVLKNQYKDTIDTDGHQYLDFIIEGAVRMKNLTENLLEYSRVGRKEQEFKSISIECVLNTQIKHFTLANTEKQKAINISYQNLPEYILCEPSQIDMLFHNLISNAIKFNENKPVISIDYSTDTDHHIFSVSDNGIGLSESYSTKVFKIFQRLHQQNYKGTGIGLALCKKITQRHGGNIWYEPNKKEGTTFYFSLKKDHTEYAKNHHTH